MGSRLTTLTLRPASFPSLQTNTREMLLCSKTAGNTCPLKQNKSKTVKKENYYLDRTLKSIFPCTLFFKAPFSGRLWLSWRMELEEMHPPTKAALSITPFMRNTWRWIRVITSGMARAQEAPGSLAWMGVHHMSQMAQHSQQEMAESTSPHVASSLGVSEGY